MGGLRIVILCMTCVAAVYSFDIFHSSSPNGAYRMSYWDAHKHCASLGAHLATLDELEELRKTSYSMCRCGWTLDRSAHFPMAHSAAGCGGRAAMHSCDWGDRWDAYCFRGDAVGNCTKPLGIENGDMHYSQMYASSEYHSWFPIFQNSKWSASIARLHNADLVNAWIPKYNGRNQYIEVDLENPTAVTGVLTQGASRFGKKMWITSFTIKYSKDGHNYKTIPKVFSGNVNNNGLKRNMFPEAVLARYIRLHPRAFHNRVALRLELLGCDLKTYESGLYGDDTETATTGGDPFLEFEPEDA